MKVEPRNKGEATIFIYQWKELVSCIVENDLSLQALLISLGGFFVSPIEISLSSEVNKCIWFFNERIQLKACGYG